MATKLTKKVVEAASPGDRLLIIFDSDVRGFGLIVRPTGSKTYIYEYRPHPGGRTTPKKRITLGDIGKFPSPDDARKEAKKLAARVVRGEDPANERQAKRAVPTFAEFVTRYLSEEAGSKLKPRTAANYELYFRRHVTPKIGTIKLDDVTKGALVRLHLAIGETKPITANRVLEAVAALFKYAGAVGAVLDGFNPAKGIKAFREQGRERFLSDDELQRLGAAIRAAETGGIEKRYDDTPGDKAKHVPKSEKARRVVLDPHAAAALRLLLLTGARLREVLHLRWEHVDFERGLLHLPDSKTGRRTVVLNSPAQEVLTNLPHLGSYVVPSYTKSDKPRADLNRPWRLVARVAGLEGVRLHDLRHTNASIGAGLGLSLPIIGGLLGHASPATTNKYAHLANDPLKRGAEAIGSKIGRALAGHADPDKPGGEVVLLRRR